MATGAMGMLRCVFEGAIAGSDLEIRRRPYHKNCGCALHDDRGCSTSSACNKISYPRRGYWSGSRLVLVDSYRFYANVASVVEEDHLRRRRKKRCSIKEHICCVGSTMRAMAHDPWDPMPCSNFLPSLNLLLEWIDTYLCTVSLAYIQWNKGQCSPIFAKKEKLWFHMILLR